MHATCLKAPIDQSRTPLYKIVTKFYLFQTLLTLLTYVCVSKYLVLLNFPTLINQCLSILAAQPSAPVASLLASRGGSGVANWVPVNGGAIPPNAVEGGIDGETLYIGRANHEGALIPGKVTQILIFFRRVTSELKNA